MYFQEAAAPVDAGPPQMTVSQDPRYAPFFKMLKVVRMLLQVFHLDVYIDI